MSTITTPRSTYKPFEYPWAFEFYLTQQKMHWLPEEVPLHEDVRDWNTKLTSNEKHLLTNIFRFFTQGDIDIAGAYTNKYLPMFPKPELRMMLSSFAAMEAVHVHAYSLLIDTLGLPESEYHAFLEYKAMADKHDYLENPKYVEGLTEDQKKLLDIAIFSAFGEGMQLFSSFAILLNFQRFGKMKGMGQIVTWSIRDESLHVDGMLKIFKSILEESPKLWTKKLKDSIITVCKDMVALEDAFIDLAFELGGIEGLTKEDTKTYVRYIADRRLIQLGIKGVFNQRENPLEWLDWIINAVEHTNFFENKSTEYAKVSLTGSWDLERYFTGGNNE